LSRSQSRARAYKAVARRAASRLFAVQALYQHDMEGTPQASLLHEFHNHRLGAKVGDVEYNEGEADFFDDIVKGVIARQGEIDAAISAQLPPEWSLDRLDRNVKAILRAATYELLARPDIAVGQVIDSYLDVADAFFGTGEKAFVNGVMDAVAKTVRTA
jgi:N utilization substance protein B